MKKITTLFFFFAVSFGLFANPVTPETAKGVAVNFYRNYSVKTNAVISDQITYQKDGLTTFYVFTFEGGGYVIVSADDAVTPILGYSTTDTFDKNNLPVTGLNWLKSYSNQIKMIVDKNLSNVETKNEWIKIQNNNFTKSTNAVTPMCSTTWDQGCYYNAQCPSDASATYSCNHVYTGCVATAMAQIMKKWAYPTTGTGTHSYTHATYGTLTANFGSTTYNWSSMPNNVNSSNAAVATLMYHCGVAVNMDYGVDGSGAYPWDVPPALINYFNYSPTAELKFLADFTTANWITMLKAEMDAGRPVLYTGDDGSSGHAFVCDGYDNNNKFHFNWGWSGSSNGYFSIGSLNPSGYNFNLDNMAVIRITPPSNAPIADFAADNTTPPVGGTVNFTNNSTNNPTTYSWVFDGGSPSTSNLQTPPAITYSTAGYYQVSLTVSNANGTDTKTRSSYINVGGTPSAWIKQNSGFATASRGIDQIAIVDHYIVWAKAYDGSGGAATIQEYTRTKNGGLSWTPGTITFTNSANFGIANLVPFNDTTCIAAMYPAVDANGGYIVKTTDGTNWSVLTNSPDYSTSWLDFVHFFNANDGLCMGDPNTSGKYIIYRTSDGGNTWTQTPVANIPNCTSGETGVVNLFDAFGDTLWFGTTKGRVYKTTDKGQTWTVTATGLGTSAAIEPRFKDGLNGIAIGTNYSTGAFIGLKKTTDGGATWTTLSPTGFFVKVPSLDYVPGTTDMWVDVSASASSSTTNPGSSYSLDGGLTFLDIDTGSVQYTTVTFYDENTGWAGGFNTSASDGGIYKWDGSVLTSLPKPSLSQMDVKVYPNPTSNYVNIEFTSTLNSKAIIDIYNLLGEKVLSKEIQPGTNSTSIDISGYNTGIYLIKINDGSKVTTKRLSKIK